MNNIMENKAFDGIFTEELRSSLPKQTKEDKKRENKYKKNKYKFERITKKNNDGFIRVIAVDESGKFEKEDRLENDDIIFIGGCSVDIPLKSETEEDSLVIWKKNIISYLSDLCEEFNNNDDKPWRVGIPFSLHSAFNEIRVKDKDGKILEPKEEKKLSSKEQQELEQLKKDFSERLQKKIKSLANDYLKLFVYLLPKNVDLPVVEESNINDLSVGANLYEDMVITAIENELFYDTSMNIHNSSLQIATRSLDANVIKEDEADELYSSGDKSGNKRYYITNTNSVKTALMHKIRYGKVKNRDIHISFNVKSTAYKTEDSLTIEDQAFLYIADIVCTVIRNKLKGSIKNLEMTTENLIKACETFDKAKYDVRIYSEADKLYRDMIDSINYAELAEYYSIKYDFCRKVEEENSYGIYHFYYDRLKKLDDLIYSRITSDEEYRNGVIGHLPYYYDVANGMMGVVENKYEKGMSVADGILSLIRFIDSEIQKGFANKAYRDKYLFRFNDILVRGHNHRGDICKTEKYIKCCEDLSSSVGIEEFLEHRQRSVQFYFNSLDYDYITDIYLKGLVGSYVGEYWNFSKIEKLKDALSGLSGVEGEGEYLLAGKIYSTMAQAMAFKRSKTADYYFDKALAEMKSDYGNKEITNSYRLQFYIDMGSVREKDKYLVQYENLATEYFDVKYETSLYETLNEQFGIIMKSIGKQGNLRFALYIYVKALKVFYLKDNRLRSEEIQKLSKRVINEVVKFSEIIDDVIHPWQLIYKNLFELELETNNRNNIKEYLFDRIVAKERIDREGPTIAAMVINFKLFYMQEMMGSVAISEEEINKIREIPGFENTTEETINKDEFEEKLTGKLTYMYN